MYPCLEVSTVISGMHLGLVRHCQNPGKAEVLTDICTVLVPLINDHLSYPFYRILSEVAIIGKISFPFNSSGSSLLSRPDFTANEIPGHIQ